MESNRHHEENMKDTILQKIRTPEFSMRPKAYFIVRYLSVGFIVFAILLVSIFLINFITFSVRINSQDLLLGFGRRGFISFFQIFPWVVLLIDLGLIALLSGLIRRWRFGYKIPKLRLVGLLIAAVVITGVGVNEGTEVNESFLSRSDDHKLIMPISQFYENVRQLPPLDSGLCRCVVVDIKNNIITVQDSRSTTTLQVILPPNDPRATTTSLRVGDLIMVAGDVDGRGIHAFGVRKIKPKMRKIKIQNIQETEKANGY